VSVRRRIVRRHGIELDGALQDEQVSDPFPRAPAFAGLSSRSVDDSAGAVCLFNAESAGRAKAPDGERSYAQQQAEDEVDAAL
jgi:hypothetical protein